MSLAPVMGAGTSDLTFDRYLNQVIAGQSTIGTLPFLAPPTLKGTYLAVRTLQELGFTGDLDTAGIQAFIMSTYNASSHQFADAALNTFEQNMRVTGYSAIEATYYAISCLNLLTPVIPSAWQGTIDALVALQDVSGGFACRPGICTVNDAYFAYMTLQLLGDTSDVNIDTLANFLDGCQKSDVTEWWQYGAFVGLPSSSVIDNQFSGPNIISAYYAIATLAACGRSSVLNEDSFVQYTSLLKNMTSNLYSVDSGTDQAEYVGTAFMLALDQLLVKDGSINYASAGASLLTAIESGNFREGRRADNNSSLSAICYQVWGLQEGGRLLELSSMAKAKIRDFIGLFRMATGSYTGYSLTRFASLHELSNLVPAIVGAGKMDTMNIDALYNYVKTRYCAYSGDFVIGINQHLYNDESCIFNAPSPYGSHLGGIPATLVALLVLKSIGRLNDFLGETRAQNYILGNVSASQLYNLSATGVHGAFCLSPGFTSLCNQKEIYWTRICPQWTLQALEIISLLDPTNPTSHYDPDSAWQYLSQSYHQDITSANFSTPSYLAITPVEWTCRVAYALCKGGMASYFSPAKVNNWVLAHINASSAREVAWHVRFVSASPGLIRATYDLPLLMTLRDTLSSSGNAWYHATGGLWPDAEVVGILAQFRADRQIYLLNPTLPTPMILGGYNLVSVDTANLFGPDLPSGATVTFTALDMTVTLTKGVSNRYSGSYQCPFNYSRLGVSDFQFTTTKSGWQAGSVGGSVAFAGTLETSISCGDIPLNNGETASVRGSSLDLKVAVKVKLGASESPAELLVINATIYMDSLQVANLSLAESAGGIYSCSYHPPAAGINTYRIEIKMQETVLSQFTVLLDGSRDNSPGTPDLTGLPAGLVVSTASGGLAVIGAGLISRRRNLPKKGIGVPK